MAVSLLQGGGYFQRNVPEFDRHAGPSPFSPEHQGRAEEEAAAASLMGKVRSPMTSMVRGMDEKDQASKPDGYRILGNACAARIAASRRKRLPRGAGSPRERSSPWLGAFAWVILAACSSAPPPGNLQYIEPDTYRVENPSPDRALVTGIGCAPTAREAEERAREVSTFNLRRVTGNARYSIEFSRLRETSESSQVCVEMQAQAIPFRLH